MPIKSSRPFVAKLCAGLVVLATAVIANSGRVSGQTLTKEYIRLNGQVVAIENAGFPQIGVNPRTLSFDPQPLAVTSVAQPVTVANSGSTAITLSGMSLGGANAADFSYTTTCGSSLAAGANCTISVQVTPSILGSETASLAVASSAPSSPSMVSLRATGTGCASNCSFAIDGGGGAAGSFVADTDYTGGSTYSISSAVNADGVINPAPQAVYQTERYGDFTYTIPGLAAGGSYTVRLHFAELYWTQTGSRVFNVSINGNSVLSNFDIVAAAGSANKAIVEEFTATATGNGQIAVQFTSVVDNAKISGIEVLQAVSSGPSYTNRKAITIHHALVPNTDQSNFPLLFLGTYPYLATASNGGGVQNVNGYDIMFTSDAAGTVPLNYERESYDGSTGKVVYWIQVPTVSHTADTVFYLWYGNTSISTDQANKTGTWDSNYQAVLHLPDGTNLSTNDSTANANNAINTGATAATGKIAGGAKLSGAPADISVPVSSATTSAITISTWVNFTGGDTYSGLFSSRDGSTGSSFSGITFDNSGGTPQYLVGTWNGSEHISTTLDQVYTHAGSWVYVAMTVTGNTMVLYVGADGTVYSDTATISGSSYSNTFGFRLGQDNGPGLTRYMTGSFDEARIAYTARSADWIATEYSNQNNPGDFYSVGP